MDRMPPASTECAPFAHVRIGGGTHWLKEREKERERGRTCDHTDPHPRVRLVKRVWVARTRRREGDRELLSREQKTKTRKATEGKRRTNLEKEQEETDEEEEDEGEEEEEEEDEEEEERGLRRRE